MHCYQLTQCIANHNNQLFVVNDVIFVVDDAAIRAVFDESLSKRLLILCVKILVIHASKTLSTLGDRMSVHQFIIPFVLPPDMRGDINFGVNSPLIFQSIHRAKKVGDNRDI